MVTSLGFAEKKTIIFDRKYNPEENDYWIMLDSRNIISETNENNNVYRFNIE